MKRPNSRVSVAQIHQYWMENSKVHESELNFDWADGETHCWNCGSTKAKRLQKCHIIPYALGGEDTASNYVLLCFECHHEAPNNSNPQYMWDWLKSNRTASGLYDTYKFEKALILFSQRRGKQFFEHIKALENPIAALEEVLKNIGTHTTHINVETWY